MEPANPPIYHADRLVPDSQTTASPAACGQKMTHAILVGIGTDGDVYPFLALGTELRGRGYRVTLASHEHFAQRAREGGLEFDALVSDAETRELWEQRNLVSVW